MKSKTATHGSEAKGGQKGSQKANPAGSGSKMNESKTTDSKSTAKDPVCGMNVDKETAVQSERDGKTFYFCSEDCQQEFEQSAKRAGNKPNKEDQEDDETKDDEDEDEDEDEETDEENDEKADPDSNR